MADDMAEADYDAMFNLPANEDATDDIVELVEYGT
jgi:hypothetical protein